MRRGLGEVREEVPWRYRKGFRQLYDVFQCDIPLTAVHATNVVAMQSGPLGQFFLRVAIGLRALGHVDLWQLTLANI